jgi:Pentapeptide repeats (8 copies)
VEQDKQARWGLRGKTVWDWLQLLIVPLALAVIGFFFTMQQDAQQQALEDRRAQAGRALEEQRTQDAALQAYLDQMSQLVLEKELFASQEDSRVRTLARARTLTVLRRLDPDRKGLVVQFLYESELIEPSHPVGVPIIALKDADLRDADLSNVYLQFVDLRSADLSGADLRDAALPGCQSSGPPAFGHGRNGRRRGSPLTYRTKITFH